MDRRKARRGRSCLSFKGFMERRNASDEQVTIGESATKVSNPKNVTNPLPVMLSFQRQQMLRFSDGKIVAVYKELRTGLEIVFPMLF